MPTLQSYHKIWASAQPSVLQISHSIVGITMMKNLKNEPLPYQLLLHPLIKSLMFSMIHLFQLVKENSRSSLSIGTWQNYHILDATWINATNFQCLNPNLYAQLIESYYGILFYPISIVIPRLIMELFFILLSGQAQLVSYFYLESLAC